MELSNKMDFAFRQEELLNLGCNPQWLELLDICQKTGTPYDISNLIRTIDLRLSSDSKVSEFDEFPVDFICKHGDIDMFKTFIILAKFDLEGNQPILSYKLTPYAADHDNFGIVAYLITNMEIDFRLALFEKCLEAHDRKLTHILLPFLPPKYVRIGANIDDLHFFLKVNDRFMQEFLTHDDAYFGISKCIVHHLDVKSLFTCRSVSKTFKHVIDREINLWNEMYVIERNALLVKFEELGKKVILNGRSLTNFVSSEEWNHFIPKIEDVKGMVQTRNLIKKYHCINNVEIPNLEVDSDLNFNTEFKSRKDIIEYLSLILHVIPLPGFCKLAPYFPAKHFRTPPLPHLIPHIAAAMIPPQILPPAI